VLEVRRHAVRRGEVGRLGDSPGHFGRPKGIALDSTGRLYALDAMFDNFQIFDRDGRLLLAIGETGSQPGQFWLANGIAIDPKASRKYLKFPRRPPDSGRKNRSGV